MTDYAAGLASDRLAANDAQLLELAEAPVFTLYRRVGSSPRGLTESEAVDRLRRVGDNTPFRAREPRLAARVIAAVRSPFVALLAGLGAVFVVLGDARGSVTVAVMIALAVSLRVWQQTRSARTIGALRDLVISTATVRRRAGADDEPIDREVPFSDVVPGDIVVLHAGDIVPADLRVVSATELVVDQSVLSGESLPVPKTLHGNDTHDGSRANCSPVDTANVCLSGTAVVAGIATGVVIATGAHTYSGALARSAADQRLESCFDQGVRTVGWTLMRFMLVMVPIVFLLNGIARGNWAQAAMFAVAVAVGLTPEMLPVIVTANLARGAARLAKDKVVVSRLNAIQDLGAIQILCVDKTGTLTEDRIVFAYGVDLTGRIDDAVAEYAYLGVHHQSDAPNRLDEAITQMIAEPDIALIADAAYTKIDEVAFDYARRRTTVVLSRQRDEHILICKGDPDQVLPRCSQARVDDEIVSLRRDLADEAADLLTTFHRRGLRVLAIAIRQLPARLDHYRDTDERELVLAGFVAFVDPVRESAAPAVRLLSEHGVGVKILTGDNHHVAAEVARHVGVDTELALRGRQIDRLSARKLRAAVARTSLFTELTPTHKTRIVTELRAQGHAVGFLGDGLNDVAAMRVADVAVAAHSATEAAKHAADLILLDKDLAVLAGGVLAGRRTLANTMKYVKITASSNFGNVLSVLAASAFLPFLPILPIQLMVANLLYDCAQLTLPWDRVDADYVRTPRRWRSAGLVSFMLVFGILSSVFDVATFGALWWLFGGATRPAVFQSGWFVEGLLTQLLVVLVLRTSGQLSRASGPAPAVLGAAAAAAAIGCLLPVTPAAGVLGLTAPPAPYWLWLIAVLAAYAMAAQLTKLVYLRHQPPLV